MMMGMFLVLDDDGYDDQIIQIYLELIHVLLTFLKSNNMALSNSVTNPLS